MALDTVPWMVGGGAEHSPAVARTLAFMATNGATGIGLPGDLRVSALTTPGGSVNVAPGAAVMLNRYPNAGQQSYIARNASTTAVTVSATGSGGGATRYVILRVSDPEFAGQPPVDPKVGPYTSLELVSSITGLAYPFVALAKIVQPANTAAITQAMITDIRAVANPRQSSVVVARPGVSSDAGLTLTAKTAYPKGETFPNYGGPTNNGTHQIDVPEWATQMEIRAEWLSVRCAAQAGFGQMWVTFGPDGASANPTRYTQAFGWDADESGSPYRTNFIIHDTQSIPAAWRGTTIPFMLRANRLNTNAQAGVVQMTATSGITLSVRFLERPDE